MLPTEHAEGILSTLAPLAAGAAHLQQLCDMLATSNLFGDLSRDKLETLAKWCTPLLRQKTHPYSWKASMPALCASSSKDT